jgi:predicted DNA-binding transcriptional regulator AlpA
MIDINNGDAGKCHRRTESLEVTPMSAASLIPPSFADDDLVKAAELARMLSVGRKTLERWSEQGHFPAPIKLGPRTTLYRVGDVRKSLDVLCTSRPSVEV